MTDFRALCIELLCSLEQYPVQPPRDRDLIDRARAARRPKPPSLKEQALVMLENAWEGGHISNDAAQTIRRALEALPDE